MKIHVGSAQNDKLSNATFDIYCVQESWFDSTIQNSEVTAMTQYSIYRRDENFAAPKRPEKMLLRRKKYHYHQMHVLRYKSLGNTNYCLLNAYVPPYAALVIMMHELASTIGSIRNKFPTDEIILLGDFNLPKIQWQQDLEIPGALSPYSESQFSIIEQKFINMCSTYYLATWLQKE